MHGNLLDYKDKTKEIRLKTKDFYLAFLLLLVVGVVVVVVIFCLPPLLML